MWVLPAAISTEIMESALVVPAKIINYILDFVSHQAIVEQGNGEMIKVFVKM